MDHKAVRTRLKPQLTRFTTQ